MPAVRRVCHLLSACVLLVCCVGLDSMAADRTHMRRDPFWPIGYRPKPPPAPPVAPVVPVVVVPPPAVTNEPPAKPDPVQLEQQRLALKKRMEATVNRGNFIKSGGDQFVYIGGAIVKAGDKITVNVDGVPCEAKVLRIRSDGNVDLDPIWH